MTPKFVNEARRLVDIYRGVRNGGEFAAALTENPPMRCVSSEARIAYAWELIDAAFDDGATAGQQRRPAAEE